MLLALSVRNIVLIDRLDLEFRSGLSVLTGETGAGKSILLDALGLALGLRAESALVRHGAEQATVAAEFLLAADHPARALMEEQGLAPAGGLLLRRQLGRDGRSRAFVNDEAVSVGFLRRLGGLLVEIEGQFEQHRLIDPASHCPLLDAFGGLADAAGEVAATWRLWRSLASRHADETEAAERARREEGYLRHAASELAALAPRVGEDRRLAETRALLRHREAILEAISGALAEVEDERGALPALASALRRLSRIADKAGEGLAPALAALERAAAETDEAARALRRLAGDVDADPARLGEAEDRLYALREAARKHAVAVDELPALAARLAAEVAAVEDTSARLLRLEEEASAARERYVGAAEALGRAREKAARRLDAAVNAELPPLKLDKARFATRIDRLDEPQWGMTGIDRVEFAARINPGTPAGPLSRIASGGELARFLLALKVALAEADPVPTLVFDEVDSGIGGATAAAVGERLARLARSVQVLAVTHSPQVAARGQHHWRVSKVAGKGNGVLTRAEELAVGDRREEIARMLSGAVVTDEARAAATRLLAASP